MLNNRAICQKMHKEYILSRLNENEYNYCSFSQKNMSIIQILAKMAQLGEMTIFFQNGRHLAQSRLCIIFTFNIEGSMISFFNV